MSAERNDDGLVEEPVIEETPTITRTIHAIFNVKVVEVDPPEAPFPMTILVLTNPATGHADEYQMRRGAAVKLGTKLRGDAVQQATMGDLSQMIAATKPPLR